jgi:diguanylate cyclase (GGDEF)-like protein
VTGPGQTAERGHSLAQIAAADDELTRLRRLYEQQQARVRELEAAQSQLLIYAEDLQGTFAELRRQLTRMNELHDISTMIGSVLEPREVMSRTLVGLGRLLGNTVACIYILEGGVATRRAARGNGKHAPPRRIALGDGPIGELLASGELHRLSPDRRTLTVALRASGATVGAMYLMRVRGHPFEDDDRKLVELVAAEAAAAIQNARLYEQTQRLATTDPHTTLFNYRYFRDALEMEVARAKRLGYAIGLLMVDLDNFKRINDTFGHPVGDDVLRDVALVLRRNLRRTDVAARYGGEEFAVILPGLGASGLSAVGEKLRRAVRAIGAIELNGNSPLQITISVGGSSQESNQADAAELVRRADGALYEAKQRGRDCVIVAPTVDEPSRSETKKALR